jgi:SOS-response transcriptional repressor LexA
VPTDHRAKLASIKRFDQLIAYLRDEMGWPLQDATWDELTFDFTADELGIDPRTAAKIQEIKRLRPLAPRQPWGIFFVKFEPKKLPVVALRRILSQVALKKRASANSAERAAWAADDLLFVSNYGEGDERQISFAHFARAQDGHDLPTLKVLGWDNLDTALHLDAVARELTEHLAWPEDDTDAETWRTRWRAAFTLRHREVVTTSKQLSIRLAELARNIRDRIKTALAIETEKGPLQRLMKAFQTSLVHDLDADGFADMYAQTIAYGLLSARIADPHRKTADDFAAHMRTNPFLRELMETFLKVGGRRGKAGGPGIDFDELGVSEVVDLLDDANMEAVVSDFGDRNPQEDPVIHFYELFLKEYDAKKRMQRGVFYTPRPVVSYIVRSVDELLRTEFGLADGLADTTTWGEMARRHKDLEIPEGVSPDQDFVQILDPATGTGTFLVEVIDLIHKTLVAKWKAQGHGDKKVDALWNEYVPKHLLTRLHGYELLMAPYAIAHLKIGLKLYETGYRFGSDERARVYLTNALEPAQDFSGRFEFAIPALAHEAAAVNEIKRHKRFTVVIGNPPYSLVSANLEPAHRSLVERYKRIAGEPLRERGALQLEKILNDDYVKFIAKSQDDLTAAGTGLMGLITNHAYLDNPTMRGLRHSFLESFTQGYFLDLGGSAKKAGDNVDENVFDIQQGVAIGITVKGDRAPDVANRYLQLHGVRETKYKVLGESSVRSTVWSALSPSPPYYLFVPTDYGLRTEYERFVPLSDVFPLHSIGCFTSKDHFVISRDPQQLVANAKAFRDSKLPDEDLCKSFEINPKDAWDVRRSREQLGRLSDDDIAKRVLRFTHRPFDVKHIFFHRSLVWSLAYPVNRNLVKPGNLALVTSRQLAMPPWNHVFCANAIVEMFLMSNKTKEGNHVFPLHVLPDDDDEQRSLGDEESRPNFFTAFLKQLASTLDLPQVRPHDLPEGLTAEDIFHYAYAVFHSPGYRSRYAEFLKIDFPRLPLPGSLKLFRALAGLGGELVALHLLESPKVNKPITEFIGGRNPEVEKVSWSNNTVCIDKEQTVGFKGVREEVWNFHIGGYQVCEKWLKDRKGRKLSKDDIAHYLKIVVALSETIRLMKEIDEVIEQHGGWPGAFQTGASKAAESTAATARVIPFRPRTVEPKPSERYVTCVPLVPLKAAAGAFGDPQHIVDDGFEWVAVESRHKLRPGMFVAQVVGKSMEPAIPDGGYCLFRAPVEGTRQGKTVLVQLRDAKDPETGQRYTVKRYESEKAAKGDSWRHERIILKPINPDFEPIVLTGKDEGELQVIAEVVQVLKGGT